MEHNSGAARGRMNPLGWATLKLPSQLQRGSNIKLK